MTGPEKTSNGFKQTGNQLRVPHQEDKYQAPPQQKMSNSSGFVDRATRGDGLVSKYQQEVSMNNIETTFGKGRDSNGYQFTALRKSSRSTERESLGRVSGADSSGTGRWAQVRPSLGG